MIWLVCLFNETERNEGMKLTPLEELQHLSVACKEVT